MASIAKSVERVLMLLRTKMRERGFTQIQVQEQLGWGRSYISQLMHMEKALRFEQILSILAVIGEDPAEFFAEVYRLESSSGASMDLLSLNMEGIERREQAEELVRVILQDYQFPAVVLAMAQLLVEKGVLAPDELLPVFEKHNAFVTAAQKSKESRKQ